jgi:hypothetical protein
MHLQFLEPVYSVCQLSPKDNLPAWALREFLAIIRTPDELTIVAPTQVVPEDIKAQHDFVCFRVSGDLAFDVVGVIAAISLELAQAKIPILSISTYNTDYFLISKSNQEPARLALIAAGYEFQP